MRSLQPGVLSCFVMPALGVDLSSFKSQFLDDYWRHYPDRGMFNGYYRYDDVMIIPGRKSRSDRDAFFARVSHQLADISVQDLSPSDLSDYLVIRGVIDKYEWYRKYLREHTWRADFYNVARVFGLILMTDYKPLDDRLRTVKTRMSHVPGYYRAARRNLTNPTREHTELAIQQNKGTLDVFNKLLREKLTESTLAYKEKADIRRVASNVVIAIEKHIAWLEARLDNDKARSFRLGRELFDQKFFHDISSEFTAEEIYQRALASRDDIYARMAAISRRMWPKYFKNETFPEAGRSGIKRLIDKISLQHVARENFVDAIRDQLPRLQQFVIKRSLLELDATRPLVVRETPAYQRGVAGASIDAPGPYDPTANTYYNVTPLTDYSAQEAESYLREYNDRMLQILNIHEAIPGHYTQLVHSNKSPSLIKTVFRNGAMVEGWGLYAERLMLEEGYGNNEPELWLMYYKWLLRSVTNTILDREIHVHNLSRHEAIDMMIEQAFQEKAEAIGKWRRATLSQVQLSSYFTGFTEIYSFREELKVVMGDEFDLRSFHNQFLSYGSMPVKYIKAQMRYDLGLQQKIGM